MHASVDLLPDGHIVQHFWCCNLSNVANLSTSFNGMNLNMWSCPSSSFGIVVIGFMRSTKRALFEVLSTKSSTKRQKTRDTQSTNSKFYEHYKLSALVQPGAVKLVLWHHWMHLNFIHSVTSENQFHCTRLNARTFVCLCVRACVCIFLL